MGQKVNPIGFRLGYTRQWDSRWYAKPKDYGGYIIEDIRIREYIFKNFSHCEISRVECIRYPDRIRIGIETNRPGLIIGKKGSDIENLKTKLTKITSKKITVNVIEIKNVFLSAKLVADNIAKQIQNRFSYKKVIKQALVNVMKNKAKGIKVMVAGRLNGAEMARQEKYKNGRIPLHTIRANIDYATSEAMTKFGLIGIKVWIYKNDILNIKQKNTNPTINVQSKVF